jgi:hypothetical protein
MYKSEGTSIGTIDVINVMGRLFYSEKFPVANEEINKEIYMPATQPRDYSW